MDSTPFSGMTSPELIRSLNSGIVTPELRDGRVDLHLFTDGRPNSAVVDFWQRTFQVGPEEAVAALHRVQGWLDEQNAQTEQIHAGTQVTSRPTLLMAPPVDRDRSNFPPSGPVEGMTNWLILKARLEAAGAIVQTPGAYDQQQNDTELWTRDRYVMRSDGTAIFPSNDPLPGEPKDDLILDAIHERDQDAEALRRHFAEQGIPTLTTDAFFEGGNVLQDRRNNVVYVGVSSTSEAYANELRSAQVLADTLGMKLVTINRTSMRYYHLDTLMAVLPDGSVIIHPDGMDADSLKRIREQVPPDRLLELKPLSEAETDAFSGDQSEAEQLSTNLVTINGNVFTPYASPEMRAFLEQRGFRVWVGPYRIADSGPHCQTNIERGAETDGRADIALVDPKAFPDLQPRDMTTPEQFTPTSGRGDGAKIALG